MRHELGRLLGQARAPQIAREEPGDPAADADGEQRRRDDRAGPRDGHGRAGRAGRPAGPGGPMGAIVPGELTAANVAGVSSPVNRDHAPCHPSGVSGHHSIDGGRGAPAGQIP